MSFDFDTVIDRRNTNSMKWAFAHRFLDEAERAADPLPMWVADMDFRSPQPVIDALADAVQHGIFGYPGGARPGFLEAVIGWQRRRFGWEPQPDWIVQTGGVITALKLAIQAFSHPGESVLIQPPVYAHFNDDVVLNGRHVVRAPLVIDGDRYRFDAGIFERAIRDDTRLFILSSPHNPTGNVWTADELGTMGEICARRGIIVVADEIHEDFVIEPTKRHVPFASLGPLFAQNSITCTAASKTFNLAGLQCASIIIPNGRLRGAFQRQLQRSVYGQINVLGQVATEAAYAHGEAWLENLLDYLRENHRRFAARVNGEITGLKVFDTDSLYLAWIDCRALGLTASALRGALLTEARLWLDQGEKFGPEAHGFMRANLACPASVVDDAAERLVTAAAKIQVR